MDEGSSEVIELIYRSLALSASAEWITCLPTILLKRPVNLKSWKIPKVVLPEDWALGYFTSQGFAGDRTRKDLYGYPGLLRELSLPPPWIEVVPDDVDDGLSEERRLELRPLIAQAQECDEERLVTCYLSELKHHSLVAEKFFNKATSPDIAEANAKFSIESFRRLVDLAKTLGVESFDAIFDAVFDIDEYSITEGAPDLFIWLPGRPVSWFFCEVKAPGDYLGSAQKEWLHQHWGTVCGHYLLMILE